MMKKLTYLSIMILSLMLWSCGGGAKESPEERAERMAKKALERAGVDEAEAEETMKKVQEMAEQAARMAEEEAAESAEDKETFSDKNVALLGLNVSERKISDGDWEKAIALGEKYKSLGDEEKQNLTPEKIEDMILAAGFEEIESARATLSEISDSRDVVLSVGMDMGMLQSTRLIDGDEAYEKEMKELGAKLNERGYSADDLRAMDANIQTTTVITEILYRLDQ
jgi:hypothetical protein